MGKILLVDDELQYATPLSALLQSYGWFVEQAETARDAEQLLTNYNFDFVLLDWNLPDMTGLELCRKVRRAGQDVPIIFVTGRQSVKDKESGLDAGGDDYITKPFDVRELLARIRTIQRRPRQLALSPLSAHGLSFNPYLRTATVANQKIQLSVMESAVLEFFLRNRNRFFSGEELFAQVWPPSAETSDDTVRAHIKLLRRKLSKLDREDLISTVKGSGYILRD